MKDKFKSFLKNLNGGSYYSGPDESTLNEMGEKTIISSKDLDKQIKNLQKENEILRKPVKELAYSKFKTRRSIRRYSPKPVEWKLIYEIVTAALNAPCAGSVENTEIIIIKDKKIQNEIGKLETQQFWLADAPYLLVFVRDDERLCELYPNKGKMYSVQNTSAIIQNVLMLAHFYDLGACWVESCNSDYLKEALDVPGSKYIDAVIPIGFPLENPTVTRAHEGAKISFEKYGNKKRE